MGGRPRKHYDIGLACNLLDILSANDVEIRGTPPNSTKDVIIEILVGLLFH
jgi:hypothetical protein